MLDKIMYKGEGFFPDLSNYRIKKEGKRVTSYSFTVKGNKFAVSFADDMYLVDAIRYSDRIFACIKCDGELYYLTYYGSGYGNTTFYGLKATDVTIYKNGGVLSSLLNHLYQGFSSLFRKWVRV